MSALGALFQFVKYPFSTAVFLVLAFPGFSLWPMAWVALIPLFWQIGRCRGKAQGFWAGFTTGVFFFAGLLYWIPQAMMSYGDLPAAAAALIMAGLCGLMASFFGLFSLTMFLLARRYGPKAFLLAPPAWAALEFARNHLALTGFAWGQLGVSQALLTPLIQIADLTGVYGVSFLVACGSTLGFFLLRPDVPRKFKTALAALLGLLFFHVLLYAELRWFQYRNPEGEAVKVAGLQGNVLKEEDWLSAHWKVYPAMVDTLAQRHPGRQVVILPENPASRTFEHDTDYQNLMAGLARKLGATLLFNGVHQIDPTHYGNSVFCLNAAGRLTSVYDKIRLVPFAEYVPFKTVFFFAQAMSREISNFTPGQVHRLHDVNGVPVGVTVCYEAIFPEEPRAFTAQGAQWLVNVTNDAWFGPTAAPWQHFQHSILRAVENRRWLVRVANSGFSCIIDPLGRVQQGLPLFQQGYLVGEVYPIADRTAYVRLGDLFAWLCVLGVGVALFGAVRGTPPGAVPGDWPAATQPETPADPETASAGEDEVAGEGETAEAGAGEVKDPGEKAPRGANEGQIGDAGEGKSGDADERETADVGEGQTADPDDTRAKEGGQPHPESPDA